MLKKLLALLLALTFVGGVVAQDAETTPAEASTEAPAKQEGKKHKKAKKAKKKKAKKEKKKKRKAKKAEAPAEPAAADESGN